MAQAKGLGRAAIAVVDRNTLAGVVRAHVAAKDIGLQLIVGARLDLKDAPSLLCLPARSCFLRAAEPSYLTGAGAGRKKGECNLSLADVAAHAEGQIFIVLPRRTGVGTR